MNNAYFFTVEQWGALLRVLNTLKFADPIYSIMLHRIKSKLLSQLPYRFVDGVILSDLELLLIASIDTGECSVYDGIAIGFIRDNIKGRIEFLIECFE